MKTAINIKVYPPYIYSQFYTGKPICTVYHRCPICGMDDYATVEYKSYRVVLCDECENEILINIRDPDYDPELDQYEYDE